MPRLIIIMFRSQGSTYLTVQYKVLANIVNLILQLIFIFLAPVVSFFDSELELSFAFSAVTMFAIKCYSSMTRCTYTPTHLIHMGFVLLCLEA